MRKLAFRMSKDEIRAVLSLADDQIFRLKFIDRKIPGYKFDAQKFESGLSGVEVLRHALREEQPQAVVFGSYNSMRAFPH
jgi:hypothetical protein